MSRGSDRHGGRWAAEVSRGTLKVKTNGEVRDREGGNVTEEPPPARIAPRVGGESGRWARWM